MNDLHGLSGAYAVDALDDLERARFEAHLSQCPDCRLEVDELLETTALLAETTATTPPPGLRDRILADIAQVRPLPPVVPPVVPPVPVRPPGASGSAAHTRRRWLPLLVAASVVAALGIGGAVVQPWSEDSSEVQLSATEQVLRADDATRHRVELTDGGVADAYIVRSPSHGKAVLVTGEMPPPPRGLVYELWLQHEDGTMAPAGLMAEGSSQQVLLDGDANAAVGAGITIEPAGGSEAPTSEPIALADFSESA